MPPSSGELWGAYFMPTKIQVLCLLPYGVVIPLECCRESTLEQIKAHLWKEARSFPMSNKLKDASSYIFISILQDSESEEFYDEGRRLCDLKLFRPWLKLIEPKGNKEEKIVNSEIGKAIGLPVSDLDSIKDPEVVDFRRNILRMCMDVVEKRTEVGEEAHMLYVYPPNVEAHQELPRHIAQSLEDDNIIVCVWVLSAKGDKQKFSLKIQHNSLPEAVIAETIRKRTRTMNMPSSQQHQCVEQYKSTYLLKVCGSDEYLIANFPLSQYKYTRNCMLEKKIPHLMIMSKEKVLGSLPTINIHIPAYMRRGPGNTSTNQAKTKSLWEVKDLFEIKINCATYVNVKELDKIYVRAGLYHGLEPLCPNLCTDQVPCSNPKWNQQLQFELSITDIPRSARLCVSICSLGKKKGQKKEGDCALAWGNVNIFDYMNRLQSGNMRMYLWAVPHGMDDLLNPLGSIGSNTNKDAPCLEIEFDNFGCNIVYPIYQQISDYAKWLVEADLAYSSHYSSTSKESIALLQEIIQRDPLHEMSEQEKELVWQLRDECKVQDPNSLPKLLCAVKWSSREHVSQLYVLLKDWPRNINVETALCLLDCTYADVGVRQFAVECLSHSLSNDELLQYLLQLVQVLKYESYLDNPLARYLLRKSLQNQRIGHFFFWHLRSEMHKRSVSRRFGLTLEAYCRAIGKYLRLLIRQVEGVDKLTVLAQSLSEKKDDTARDRLKFLTDQMSQADFIEKLEHFTLPLNPNHSLGKLSVEKCKILSSAKRPLWLVWENHDLMAEVMFPDIKVLFKRGDDLKQDMLTLQMLLIMHGIWQREGLDLKLIPYSCLSTGNMTGMIEIVRNSKTIYDIQHKSGLMGTLQLKSGVLHQWIKVRNKDQYDDAIDRFTRSCAGYCVATFILGIGDRHNDNIMVTENGQIFHIDFGHFLGHIKKKYGIKRERVPFVLTEDFLRVIVKGQDVNIHKTQLFKNFQQLCIDAYVVIRRHANLLISLFSMMLMSGIPELQSIDDIAYLRQTLAVEKTDDLAVRYFLKQLNDAHGGGWTTKVDWFFHALKHR
ncbi:phosphatidylinositol 4,5-bisphosphate 3-kinase catalytic subunit alpha isoform-like isoform X1 [Antedon mediterranea]|uniref:phosphatidylinositol 4,5-bisphosphate 3-kinase catalytic subunit alpha isoform-like isoform X1 n=1 Tax=Antedon mediterranea TaxID=105859 RepID=UPI003AF95C2A